jgi:formiminoglutamase
MSIKGDQDGSGMTWLSVTRGEAPLLVSLPHTGTTLPEAVVADLVSRDLALYDTDWWIDRLYDFAAGLGATVLHTAISRTVIDVNRDPSGASLYPGQATTGLCPTTTFDGRPLYRLGAEPDAAEIARRREIYFEPYHRALAGERDRLRALHPDIVVYDCHSIRSRVPRLFEGELPVLNIGTNGGVSAAPAIEADVVRVCESSPFSTVLNGRFKGGWITRSLGKPADGVHAVQMEIACRGYVNETVRSTPTYDPDYAAPMRRFLQGLLGDLIDLAGTVGRT